MPEMASKSHVTPTPSDHPAAPSYPVKHRHIGVSDYAVTEGATLTLKQSLVPYALVTVLFFMWGFAYGLLDTLNAHFQGIFNISRTQSTGLQVAYFGAYFISPPTFSGWILRKWGYKATFIVGLILYGIGGFLFWPAVRFHSFGGICAAQYIVASGLATLEVAADPYVTVCGPPKYAEMRLNFSQAFQGVGSFVAPLIATRTFFHGENATSLTNMQWVYMAVGSFAFLLAVVFFFAKIPEITDSDMHHRLSDARGKTVYDDSKSIWKQWPLFWGVAAQFCYVGAQVALATFFINFAVDVWGVTNAVGSNYLSGAQIIYTIGRFIATGIMKFIEPHYVYTFYIISCFVFAAAASNTNGFPGVALYMTIFFFESACFATIFACALRGLGRHTKRGGSFLVMGISGGMVFPSLQGVVADNVSTHRSVLIPMMGYILASTYGLYLCYAYREVPVLTSRAAEFAERKEERLEEKEPEEKDSREKQATMHVENI